MNKIELFKLKMDSIKSWKDDFKGKNITEIARKSGISRTTIYNVVNGDCIPNIATINRIREVLNEMGEVK